MCQFVHTYFDEFLKTCNNYFLPKNNSLMQLLPVVVSVRYIKIFSRRREFLLGDRSLCLFFKIFKKKSSWISTNWMHSELKILQLWINYLCLYLRLDVYYTLYDVRVQCTITSKVKTNVFWKKKNSSLCITLLGLLAQTAVCVFSNVEIPFCFCFWLTVKCTKPEGKKKIKK